MVGGMRRKPAPRVAQEGGPLAKYVEVVRSEDVVL